MTTVIDHPRRGYRTIRLALAEADTARFMSDGEFARAQLDQMYSRHPELFPEAWGRGYALCGFTEPSRKQAGLRPGCGVGEFGSRPMRGCLRWPRRG